MFCYKCGKQLDEGTNFCPHCGATQKKDENNQQKEDAKKVKSSQKQMKANKKVIAIVCVVVVILGTVIGIISSNNAKKKKEEAMVSAIIGSKWFPYWGLFDDYVMWTFVDEDTIVVDLEEHGGGVNEYKWWVTEVTDDQLVFATELIKSYPYNVDIGEGSVSFREIGNGKYTPYALFDSEGNVEDTQ